MRDMLCAMMCSFCCLSGVAAGDDTVVVENDHLQLVFETAPVPWLKQLVHKPSGEKLLAEEGGRDLFTLSILRAEGGSLSVASHSAQRGSLRVVRAANGQRILVEFAGLGPGADIGVVLEGMLDDSEPFVRWSIAVNNPGSQRLARVRCPNVSAVAAIGDSEDDFLIAPYSPGAMIENPAENWPARYSMSWTFPGSQSAQFCAYQDCRAGIYLASMDSGAHSRALSVLKSEGGYRLYQDYVLPETQATEWKSPYSTALGVTAGNWQQTADIYKCWAVHQPWCAKTLAQRDDIPDYWKRGPCVHTVEVRTYDGKTRLCNGSYYPQLADHLRLLRERIDGPVVPMLAGWENHRRWTAGEYFPIFDEEQAKGVLDEMRRDGFRPFVFLSGLFFTFQNEGRDGGDLTAWKEYADAMVVDALGKPKPYVLNESSSDGKSIWKRHSYQLCPAAPATREFFRSVLDKTHALGIDIVQMDQGAFGYMSRDGACYSISHGHHPGVGSYPATAFLALLEDMRGYGKSLNPDFLLMVEELHEEAIPYLDGFHTREYKEKYWYRAAPGARGIPLFSYLYHEYAIAYGGDSAGVSRDPNMTHLRSHAVNMVTGKTPGISVWSSQPTALEAHPDQIEMVRNHLHLLDTESQRFLMLGRMLHPLEFDTPSLTIQMAVKRDGKWRREPFEERAVMTSSWQSPEKLVGHCLVNISSEKQVVRLPLDTRNAPGWPRADIDLYRAGNPKASQSICRGATLPHECSLELAPREAVFFVIRPTK